MRHRKKGSKAVAKPLPVEINLDEFTKIMDKTRSMHHRIAFLLAWGSGLRITEVINLKQGDFNWEEHTIRINMGKNSKDRIVPIAVELEPWHIKEFIPIPCAQRALQKALKKYAGEAGVLKNKPTAHFHSLRHGFATHCLRCGMSLPDIRDHLGHADLATTSIYTHLAPKERIDNYIANFRRLD